MKKLPYKHCFVILQINNNIKKIFFDNVVNYEKFSNPNYNEHKSMTASVALVEGESAEKLFMLLNQSYLNSKKVINEFKDISKRKCVKDKNACVLLIVDIHEFEDGSGTIQICTNAFDDKKDGFNHIAEHLSHSTMENFVDSLSNEMQDELFDI